MRPSGLRQLLRLAALNALAVGGVSAAGSLAACGGSVAGSEFGDAGEPGDGATSPDRRDPGDGGAPLDATFPDGSAPDAAPPVDAARDALLPDGACSAPPLTSPCGSEVVSCLPPGLVVGQNPGTVCAAICQVSSPCQVTVAPSGGYRIDCMCAVGRFPAGLSVALPRAGEDPVGAYLARGAALEASAVRAFEQLAREVAAHGAPAELVGRLRRAARQEIRHARLLGAAARARGAKLPRLHARRAPVHARSLFALALENAVEGCGREALGGALLHAQAARAEDAGLRAVLAELADDECAHAELSADLGGWLASRLSDAERARLDDARREFFAACEDAPPTEDPAVARALGFPAPGAWRRLVRAVASEMTAARAAA